jgi:hypothetical protein
MKEVLHIAGLILQGFVILLMVSGVITIIGSVLFGGPTPTWTGPGRYVPGIIPEIRKHWREKRKEREYDEAVAAQREADRDVKYIKGDD